MTIRIAAVLSVAWMVATAFTAIADEPLKKSQAAQPKSGITIRCAVIGGMMDTDFWPSVVKDFEQRTGHRVEVVAQGPKHEITQSFIDGDADLITMHASDTIINLVADGYGVNPLPWARNDLLLVGPPADPAGIRGEKDAARALTRIIETKSKLLVHASLGTNEVLHDLLAAGELSLDPERTISLPGDKHRQMLKRAVEEEAYTLVGRIPFLNAKIPSAGAQIMVQGDPRLRRPYVVVVAHHDPKSSPPVAAARELAAYLREPATQQFIFQFGRGQLDDQPLFFPVVTESRK